MLAFFKLAAVSPGRQRSFRSLLIAHVFILLIGAFAFGREPTRLVYLGHLLLVTGIVEGALVIGWRLAQMPKSQALEFVLATPLRPSQIFLAEAAVGLSRLGMIAMSGLPILAWLVVQGHIFPSDGVVLVVVPFLWGAFTGFGLVTWAYEPPAVRRWGERITIVLVIIYLVIGVLAAENLGGWIMALPGDLGRWLIEGITAWHAYNPFAALQYYLEHHPATGWLRLGVVQMMGLAGLLVLGFRSATRLAGHYHDLHYRPAIDRSGQPRDPVSERPLSWWAVRRVSRYSGRINLWLAGGFGMLYALYIMAGDNWQLGRAVFEVFDRAGGVPTLVTALMLLAAVPAAFQYGLWDASVPDRCRRLELLLLTRLEGRDYWQAAAAAAWTRGRGYFLIAAGLLAAGCAAGQLSLSQALVMLGAGTILWGLYFALGFRAFASGMQANALGLALTVALPLLAYCLYRTAPFVASLFPPASIFYPSTGPSHMGWMAGPTLGAVVALVMAHTALQRADADLRRWYDRHHGFKAME